MHSSACFFPAYQSVRHVAADSQGAKEPKQPLGCMRTVLVASLRLAGDRARRVRGGGKRVVGVLVVVESCGINQSEADIACAVQAWESAKPERMSRKNSFLCILSQCITTV
jgi:hypothetical protein